MNNPALKITEFTVASGRDAMDILANGANTARHEHPVSPLIYRAASELIGRDDRGLKTNIQSYGLPHVVLSDVAEQLETLGVSSFASASILDALSTYAVGLGAEFAREAQAKPLYARIMVTNKKPDDLPDCALVQTTLIDGTRRVGDGVSQRVMQSTIYGTRTSMTRSMEVDEMLASSQKKWLLIFYGSPTQEGDMGFNGQGLNNNDVALINLVQGLGSGGTIPTDTLQELEQIIRDEEGGPTHFDVVRLIENFALIQNMIEPYRDVPTLLPNSVKTDLSNLITRSTAQLSMISTETAKPLLTTAMMVTLVKELETIAVQHNISPAIPASDLLMSSMPWTTEPSQIVTNTPISPVQDAANDAVMIDDIPEPSYEPSPELLSASSPVLSIIETLITIRQQPVVDGLPPSLSSVINDPAVVTLIDAVKILPAAERPAFVEKLIENPALSLSAVITEIDTVIISLSQPQTILALKTELAKTVSPSISAPLALLVKDVETLQTTAPRIIENSLSRVIMTSLENSAKPAPLSSPTLSIPAIASLAAIIPTLPAVQREQMVKTLRQDGVAGLIKEMMITPQPSSSPSGSPSPAVAMLQTLAITHPTTIQNVIERNVPSAVQPSSVVAPKADGTIKISAHPTPLPPAIADIVTRAQTVAALYKTPLPLHDVKTLADLVQRQGIAALADTTTMDVTPASRQIINTLLRQEPSIAQAVFLKSAEKTIATTAPLSGTPAPVSIEKQTLALVTQALLNPERSITKTQQGLQQQIKLVQDIQAKGLTAALQSSPALAIQMQTIIAPVVADRVGMVVKQSASIPAAERATIAAALEKGGLATLAKPEILKQLSPTTRQTVLRTMEQTLSVTAGITTSPVIQRAMDAVRVSMPVPTPTSPSNTVSNAPILIKAPTVAELIKQSSPVSLNSQPSSFSSPKTTVAQMVEALRDAPKLREFLSNPGTRQNPNEYVQILRAIPPETLPTLPPQERQMLAEAKITLSAMVLEQSLVKMAAEGQPINRATIQHLSQAIATGQPSAIERAVQQVTETLARTNTPVPLAVAEVNAAIRSFAPSPDMPLKSAPANPPSFTPPDLPKFTTLYTPPSFPTGDTTIKVGALKPSVKPESPEPCKGGPNCPKCAAVFAAAAGKGEASSPTDNNILDKSVGDAVQKIKPETNGTGKTTPTFNNHASGCGCKECAINEIGADTDSTDLDNFKDSTKGSIKGNSKKDTNNKPSVVSEELHSFAI